MNRVAQKIMDEAVLEIEKLKLETEERLASIRSEHVKKVESLHNEQQKLIHSLEDSVRERKRSVFEIEMKKELLRKKHSLIDQLKEQTVKRITEDRELYIRFCRAMLRKGILSGKERIVVSREDRDIITDGFLNEINREIKESAGINSSVVLSSESRETGGGFFLLDERIEYNATVKLVVRHVFREHETEIGRMLFGESMP